MIKINRKSKEGLKKKIASLSLVALLFNATMIGVLVPSGNMLNATAGTEGISAKTSTFVNPKCEKEHPNEWHFVINQIESESKAPASIHVTWSNTNDATILLDKFTGKVAHYRTTENLDSTVTNATANIYSEWSEGKGNGQFNLSHGPCCTPPEETGSITICKIIIDENGDIVDGNENDGEFTISGIEINGHNEVPDSTDVLANAVFETILVYDADLIGGDQVNDAKCILYDNLEIDGSYYYSEEAIVGKNWETPLYNDQFTKQVTTLNNFYPYSGELFNSDDSDDEARDTNADGHIVLSSNRPDRTLVVLNEYETPNEVTIVASKIVCDNETDLPNWGGGESPITKDTATEFIADNPDCHLEKDWYFQVGDQNATKKDGDYYNEAPEDSWTTFGPTVNGEVETTVDISNIAGSQLRLREVLQDGYIPFAYNDATEDNSNDISAEFYCADDVYKYDNYDWITNPIAGETYYCVAFNAPIESAYSPYCGDGIKNQEWEECDGIDGLSGSGYNTCTELSQRFLLTKLKISAMVQEA